jgi:hypothetical protein
LAISDVDEREVPEEVEHDRGVQEHEHREQQRQHRQLSHSLPQNHHDRLQIFTTHLMRNLDTAVHDTAKRARQQATPSRCSVATHLERRRAAND